MSFNADDFAQRVNDAKTVSAVTDIFNDVARLSVSDQKLAMDAMENMIVSDWRRGAPPAAQLAQLRMVVDMVDELKGTPEGDMLRRQMEGAMNLGEQGEASSLAMRKISEFKGEATHALLKTYIAEQDKLPADEVNTGFGIAKLMVTVEEKLQAEASASKPKPSNPFRNKPNNFDF